MAEDVNRAVRNPSASAPARLIVGISGASGVTYGVRVLDALRELGVESHLVVTRAALLTLSQETDLSADDLMGRADVTHRLNDVGASIASGSFRTMGMIIAPCSARTMGEIATGVTSTLLTRAADLAFCGKSLAPHEGGQTPVEAAAAGVPLVYGPAMTNFRAMCEGLETVGAARCGQDAEDVSRLLQQLVHDREARQKMQKVGPAWLAGNRGASERTWRGIERLLPQTR